MNSELLALDPLLRTNVKLFINHVLDLKPTENVPIELFNFHNHIIKFVEICGLIVGVENKASQVYYTVDDSTGTIPCCYWIGSNFNYKPIKLGTLVRVLGKIATFRGQRQIIIDDIFPIKDPNEELAHFVEKYTLLEEYKNPFELPTEQEMKHDLMISKLEGNLQTLTEVHTVKGLANLIFDLLDAKYAKNEQFTMTFCQRHPKVVDYARRILDQKGEFPENHRILEVFNEAINVLMKDGVLSAEGTKKGVFILVDKTEIEQFVMKTISDACKISDRRGGIHKVYIITKLKNHYGFEKKSAGIVAQITIADLFEKGFIYPTNDRMYRVTFE